MPIGSWLARLRKSARRLTRRPRSDVPVTGPDIVAADRDLVFSLSPSRLPNMRQLRLLPKVLQPTERTWLRLWFSLGVIALLTLGVQLVMNRVRFVPASGGTLTEGAIGTPQYINPILARTSTVDELLTRLVYRGLMKVNADGQIVPDLAQSISASADGKTYTLKMTPNLHWSDDEGLTSQDAVFTFETIIDSTYKSPLAGSFRGVTVTAPNNQTVVFTLPAASNSFPALLTTGLLPAHAWVDTSPQTFALAELNTKPTVSNGPFRFQSLTKDRTGTIHSYTFIRNKAYHGSAPFLDKVIVKFYPDQPQALDALSTNSIDTLGNITLSEVTNTAKHNIVTAFPLAQVSGVFFNQGKNPALKVKEVRQALSTAVDRDQIINQVLHGYGRAIVGPILPGSLGYNEFLKRFDFNLTNAEKMLDDAGWKKNDQGIRQKGAQQLTFVFTSVDEPISNGIADRLVTNWKALGANIEHQKIEASRIQKDVIKPRQYEALLFSQRYDIDPDPYPFWHSTQQRDPGFNLAIFFNKKIDQDLEDGRTTTSVDQRRTDYLDFQNILAEEVPAIFLYQSEYLYAHQASLRGLTAKRLVAGVDRFLDIDNWYIKRKLAWQ